MPENKYNSLRIGFFIFIGFLLFVAAILILGRKRNMFKPTINISTVFRDVRGLKVGNNVRFTGIEVGTIVAITILSDTAVNVEMSMERQVIPYIKKNSVATIGNDGLMGNKIVIILPGTPGTEVVSPGDILPSIKPVEIDDIIADIQNTSTKISQVANNLIEITNKINHGDGLFGKVFTDSDFSEDIERSGRNIARLSKNLAEITGKLNDGKGIMGKVLFDPEFSAQWETTTENLAEISGNLQILSENINHGDGILGKMITDTAMADNFFNASQYLETVLQNLSELSVKLNNERNALHKFITDTAFADSIEVLLGRVNQGVVEVSAAAETLKSSKLLGGSAKREKKKKEKDIQQIDE
jgi:phospholipid/cholesterol/gamma-HCH transport system substrate-binding protein